MISIIMPAYNAALYIKEAITSVLNQTYQDWELLLLTITLQMRQLILLSIFLKWTAVYSIL